MITATDKETDTVNVAIKRRTLAHLKLDLKFEPLNQAPDTVDVVIEQQTLAAHVAKGYRVFTS